ncbi:putative pyridoxal-dependent decarboxylase domain-containing protein 2 isoform X4 [Tachypleus tridentatus]|uniref:putative pyridoxal-dependent decarboxylase domain-containing protein 2 isoform X4 n=1 Tax=Tachypleus tridentatus TaxID=6853 RepID=UPI003FD4EF2D
MRPHSGLDEQSKKDASKSVPGPLQTSFHFSGLPFKDIEHLLEGVILYSDEEKTNEKSRSVHLRQLDEIGKMAVMSHTLAAYISTLDTRTLRKVVTRILSDTTLWLSRLFRLFEFSAYFHDDGREGLLKVCRMVLYMKYSKFAAEGYEALYTRPPVIYISAAARMGLGHYLCSQLGLPLTCLVTVPCNTMFGSQFKMDIAALEKLIQQDIATQRTPLLIVGHVGTPVVGHVDNLQRLQELCKMHDMWLHVDGHGLAGLCLVSVPNLPARIGDSVTLTLGTWLGVPSLSCITLYKAGEPTSVHAAGLSAFNLHGRLSCLPLWVTLQGLGHEGIVQRIQHCFTLSEYFLEKVEKIPRLQILGKNRLKSKDGNFYTVQDIVSKSVSTTLLFDILASVITFQYVPEEKIQEEEEISQPTKNPDYYNNLNSWLGLVVLRDIPTIHLDILDLKQHGVALRFCPLESAHVTQMTKEDIDEVYNCLQQQVAILNATVHQKDTFTKLLVHHENLQLVEIANWAGLGGVRFIPGQWVGLLNELTERGKEEINKINSSLVQKLKNSDSAFSLGEGDDGMLCVRFGMVTDDLDMEDLVNLVLSTGQELEESSKLLESMAEVVKQGIEEASKGLKQENEEKVMQDGVLKYVPIVGNLINWWQPSPKESGVKGRSFNLASGVLESTENIYKYHMQIQHDSPQTPSTTKAIISRSSDHSRSSSHSSQQWSTIGNGETVIQVTKQQDTTASKDPIKEQSVVDNVKQTN